VPASDPVAAVPVDAVLLAVPAGVLGGALEDNDNGAGARLMKWL
jgi:hypothetical protein